MSDDYPLTTKSSARVVPLAPLLHNEGPLSYSAHNFYNFLQLLLYLTRPNPCFTTYISV